jgi:hypothetical protein
MQVKDPNLEAHLQDPYGGEPFGLRLGATTGLTRAALAA